jgi:hypothetical protein
MRSAAVKGTVGTGRSYDSLITPIEIQLENPLHLVEARAARRTVKRAAQECPGQKKILILYNAARGLWETMMSHVSPQRLLRGRSLTTGDMVRVIVNLRPEQYDELFRHASEVGTTMSAFCRESIVNALRLTGGDTGNAAR